MNHVKISNIVILGSEKLLPFRQSLQYGLWRAMVRADEPSVAGELPGVPIRKNFGVERKEL
jgi:hypothetical protein